MCVKYCRVTPTITYLYFVFVKKKRLQEKKFICSVLSKGDELHVVWQPLRLRFRHSGGVRGQTDGIDKEMAVLIKAPSIFLPDAFRPSYRQPWTLPHRRILKRNIQSWAWRKTVQMFIFYSFQVPVFCGVIWILTNSFMCSKRVQVDEWIWMLKAKWKSCVTLYKNKTSRLVT